MLQMYLVKFAILHVAVDNNIFVKLLCFCSIDRSFQYCFVLETEIKSLLLVGGKSLLAMVRV
jgi:hypothetical protein